MNTNLYRKNKEENNMEKIIRFYLYADQLEKWMYQNKACYTGACIEGTLLDNFVLDTEIGYAAFYESPVNEWTSRYYVEYGINRKNKPCSSWRTVWKNWYDFADKAENDSSILYRPKEELKQIFQKANTF